MGRRTMSNAELIEKATVTTAALASAGKLNPAQADRFLDFVIDETQMRGMSRIVRFRNEQMDLDKINVANRVALPKAEAADPGVRRGVTTSKVVLTPKEIMCPFEIGDLFKEHSIEGDSVEEHILKMMGTRLANNLEELYWDGNTVGPAALESDLFEGGSSTLYRKDTYLELFDGWLQLAESGNVVDAQNAPISPNLLSRALNAMPNKFKRNRANLKFLASWNHEQDFRETISSRASMRGDEALAGGRNLAPFGVELVPVSLLNPEPTYVEDSTANTDGTTATALSHAPITNLVLSTQTLGNTPEAKFVAGAGNDYTVDEANGTWTRLAGNIGSGVVVKATYQTAGRLILTQPSNIILAIGRDIRIERDRNIYKTVNEFAITVKVFVQFEEITSVVLVKNVAVPS